MHTLDWKHAWTGRLLTTAPTRPQALKLLEPQLDSCNARLIGEVASGKLPFLNLPFRSSLTARLKALTPQLRRFKHMVVLGMGGSALGTRALQKAFFPQQDLPNHQGPWLWILDNVDADVLEAQMSTLNPEETIVVPVSKSGGTIETLAQYFFMKAWLQRALPNTWHEHMLLVTDERRATCAKRPTATTSCPCRCRTIWAGGIPSFPRWGSSPPPSWACRGKTSSKARPA